MAILLEVRIENVFHAIRVCFLLLTMTPPRITFLGQGHCHHPLKSELACTPMQKSKHFGTDDIANLIRDKFAVCTRVLLSVAIGSLEKENHFRT